MLIDDRTIQVVIDPYVVTAIVCIASAIIGVFVLWALSLPKQPKKPPPNPDDPIFPAF